MKPERVDAKVIRTLADVAGIDIPDEDMEPLIAAFKNHMAGMEALEGLDLEEHDPITVFDPRWR
jgi:Asp-tRNA(Asn)/Glu-tRNA(Gln) amidotransferase C subunit